MERKKGNDESRFGELIGEVQPLREGPAKIPLGPRAQARTVPRSERSRRKIVVEGAEGVVLGYASDSSLRSARELARLRSAPRRLDLHRMSAAAARAALGTAVRQARAEGVRLLLVIFGKGRHSHGGQPVLPALVVEELTTSLAAAVVAFRTAPSALGGEGALLVRLR